MTDTAEKDVPVTGWPICTRKGAEHRRHVGNEDYSEGSPAWGYVDKRGDATCSCCDPVDGFPCIIPPAGQVER